MSDMSATIVPKSDQMNADDLIGGPLTIKIKSVQIAPGTEQPVAVSFHGDNGKPYLPCKSMRRVMVLIWGADASVYAGRSMTLYRDPSVTWGGMEVGGIRISHMSEMEKQTIVVLTATKKTRKPFTVSPLFVPPEPVSTAPPARRSIRDQIRDGLAACFSLDEVVACADSQIVKSALASDRATDAQKQDVRDMLAEAYARFADVDDGGRADEP